ncbi:MAG: precorrin-6y C5,15-methyltransferase (decarboxylating) subunit CbiE [Candidatus Adiutrix intracellularis]|jgi:precorrin-6Y C5,15-methyltransferase (decarboxylating)|nr:precorrin-6y C5,15-methyltransferase (decarboxylating) subunit CbiE [Candidatus Adiutrix intracellularis]
MPKKQNQQLPPMHLIGLCPDLQWLSPAATTLINEADILAGGNRLLELFSAFPGKKYPLSTPLKPWLKELKALQYEGKKITILSSGDPNYFGLAQQLIEVIGSESLYIHPSTTLVQQAFARLKTSWKQTEVVSLHGREAYTNFWSALFRTSHYSGSGYLAIYTDPKNTPAVIAKHLLERGQNNWRMIVFEDMDTQDERHTTWTLMAAKIRNFSPLNIVILECLKRPASISLGMPEEAFLHENGLITKREIRVVALGLLELQPYYTLWDLGAGSGSLSIEAAALLPHGSIWAVEKSPLRSEQIVANRTFFGATQVEIIKDEALAAIVCLPSPDRIFIGGGGANLGAIIKAASYKLHPKGKIVAGVITLDSLRIATMAMRKAGLELSVTQIQGARSEPLGDSLYLRPFNQVWLIRGIAL